MLRRLAQPDAASLVQPPQNTDTAAEMAELRQRRDQLAGLVGDGLLTASNARPRLEAIAERLAKLEAETIPAKIDPRVWLQPRQTWQAWTMPQRREALRVLLEKVTLRHVGPGGGPRADPTRVNLVWAKS